GSRADMCGNGLRCLAQWSFSRKYAPRSFFISTARGKLSASICDSSVKVDVGEPVLTASEIPVQLDDGSESLASELTIKERKIPVFSVGMGNPHCVIFQSMKEMFRYGDEKLAELAQTVQQNPLYPEG